MNNEYGHEINIEEMNLNIDLENLKSRNEIRKDLILNDTIKYSNTIEFIKLNNLVEIDPSINFFDYPDNEEFLDLVSSIEHFSIINPLLVIKNESDNEYTVVSGRSRLLALRSLYKNSKDDKFLSAPCIILDSKISPSLIQGIIISTNLKYRKISRENLIKSILKLNGKGSKNCIKIRVNEMHMAHYLNRGYVTQSTLDKIIKKDKNVDLSTLL